MELSNAMFNRGTVEEMSCLTIHGMELSNATFNRGTVERQVCEQSVVKPVSATMTSITAGSCCPCYQCHCSECFQVCVH